LEAALARLEKLAREMDRKAGQSVALATAALEGKSVADKNELLFQAGINFNDLPPWQRRGTGLYWERYEREGYNPKLGQKVATTPGG
jgi:tRNA(His) 5'-end guanylyltransferase